METLVSKILFLDRDFQPCGTRVIRRPGITRHNDRTDSKKIMAVGMGAFDDGDFGAVPQYWVPYEGDIKDFRDMYIRKSDFNLIESLLVKHFKFISIHEVNRKTERIKALLGFSGAYRCDVFEIHEGMDQWIKKNQVVISLVDDDWDGLKFSIGDFLRSIRNGIDECSEAIETIREQIMKRRKDMRFVMETASGFRHRSAAKFIIVGTGYVDFEKYHKLIFSPAYNNLTKITHDLKKRMQELERQRSYMQTAMNLIMAETWHANY